MTLALSQEYPIWDLLWTMLMIFAFALFLWTLIVVFRDLFSRKDLSTWAALAWLVFIVVVPLIGSLAYLISQSPRMAQERAGAAQLQMDAYTHSLTGQGGYHHIHETVTRREAMVGPNRQDSA